MEEFKVDTNTYVYDMEGNLKEVRKLSMGKYSSFNNLREGKPPKNKKYDWEHIIPVITWLMFDSGRDVSLTEIAEFFNIPRGSITSEIHRGKYGYIYRRRQEQEHK